MLRLPSIKTLSTVFADKAKEARSILEMSRYDLSQLPAGADRLGECYHAPKTYDLRLHCLDALGHSHGVEACRTDTGEEFADYLNTGDTYTPTLIYWRGRYLVQSLGDFIETMERQGVRFS